MPSIVGTWKLLHATARDAAAFLGAPTGATAAGICPDIAADLGGAPNAAQQILCQMFALKILRMQLLVQKILSGETVNLHTANYA